MIKPLNESSLAKNNTSQSEQNSISSSETMMFFESIFGTDIRFKVLVVLSNREGACLREIARNVGISHNNLSKYIEALVRRGIVEAYPIGLRNTVYRLAAKYNYMRQFL